MTIENISLSISTKVFDQARIKHWASGSTIRLTNDCPSGPVIYVYAVSIKVSEMF